MLQVMILWSGGGVIREVTGEGEFSEGGGVAICERPTGEFGYRDGRRNGRRTPAWWREEAECSGKDAGGGNGDEISRNVVCNRKFNRREPGNSAGGERKRRARESEKTSRRRERGGKCTPELLAEL